MHKRVIVVIINLGHAHGEKVGGFCAWVGGPPSPHSLSKALMTAEVHITFCILHKNLCKFVVWSFLFFPIPLLG